MFYGSHLMQVGGCCFKSAAVSGEKESFWRCPDSCLLRRRSLCPFRPPRPYADCGRPLVSSPNVLDLDSRVREYMSFLWPSVSCRPRAVQEGVGLVGGESRKDVGLPKPLTEIVVLERLVWSDLRKRTLKVEQDCRPPLTTAAS